MFQRQFQLVGSFYRHAERLRLGIEHRRQFGIVPGADIVVRRVLAKNITFDGVTIIVNQEDNRLLIVAQQGGNFLSGQLERTVANEQQMPAIRCGHHGPQQRRQGIANRAPDRLIDHLNTVRHTHAANRRARGAILHHNYVIGANKALYALP